MAERVRAGVAAGLARTRFTFQKPMSDPLAVTNDG